MLELDADFLFFLRRNEIYFLSCRWTTIAWPHKLMQMIDQVSLQWEEDEERFRKLQLTDLTSFNDRIDALTVRSFRELR